jgi:phage terminase large subunit-like protein
VSRYEPTCDKIMRLHAQTAMIENGFVHIPETAPWLAEYLHEMTVFPKSKHDDQVDSTASATRRFDLAVRHRSCQLTRPPSISSGADNPAVAVH